MLAGSLECLYFLFFLFHFVNLKYQIKNIFTFNRFFFNYGFWVILFLNLSLGKATLVAPIIIGAQLAIPFAILVSSIFLNEKVSLNNGS